MSLLLLQRVLSGAAVSEVISLSGTSVSQNTATNIVSSPDPAEAGWRFNTDGTVDRNVEGIYTQFQTGVEWSDLQPIPGQDYWIRAQADSGTGPDITSGLNLWLAIFGTGSANREWGWTQDGGDIGTNIGAVRVDIATDAAGSNIVATGYYRGSVEVEL